MTGRAGCAEPRALLGVYVLGAIDPAERALVDAHLRGCRHCRDELAGLAGLPALLGRVTDDQLAQVGAAPPEPLERVLRQVAAERRARRNRGRLRLAAAAAVAVLMAGAGVAGGLRIGGGRTTPPPGTVTSAPAAAGRTLSGSNAATGVSASVTMRPADWGTAFTVRLTGVPPGSRCRLIAVDRDGRRDIAGGWRAEYAGYADFHGSSMLPSDRIASVEIRTVEGRPLLVLPA